MAIIDEEEKRKRAAERRAAGQQYQQKREELLAQNEAITAQKQAQEKTAGQKASYKPMTGSQVEASISTYSKKKPGDNDMAKAAQMYSKDSADVSSMSFEDAMGFATRIVYDDERDDFLKRWQASEKKRNGKAPTLDEMRDHLNRQKPGGLYSDANAAYSKQVKDQFAADYKAIQENKKNQATISAQMTALSGLTDLNGNAVDVNTASLEEIIRSIKADPDKGRRTAFAGAIKELTKTPGSRFYGVEFDDSAAKEFINSAALTQEDYDNQVERFAGRFNPLEGHEQENLDEYAYWAGMIDSGDYSAYVKTAYKRALDAAYRQQTQKDELPDLTNYVPPQREGKRQEKTEYNWLERLIMGMDISGDDGEDNLSMASQPSPVPSQEPTADPTQAPEQEQTVNTHAPSPSPTPSPTPSIVPKVDKAAHVVQTSTPVEEREVQGPPEKVHPTLSEAMSNAEFAAAYDAMQALEKERDASIPQGSIDLTHDPIKAAQYALDRKADLLTRETQEAYNKLAMSSPGVRAILRTDVDATQDQLLAAQDGDAKAMAYVDGTRKYWATGDASAIIGSTLGSYLALSDSDAFPQELRTAMQGALLEIVVAAEDAYERGEFDYDPRKGTLYDAYIKENPSVMQTVRGVKKAVSDMYLEQRERERLAANEAAMNEQALLEEHRAQVRSGTYTPEAYAHVIEKAPLVTMQTARTDATYRAMAQEIDIDRTLADGMDDSWHNQMADRYLRENGRPLDLNSVEAMQYKDSLSAYEKDILLSDMRAAETLGYGSLEEMYAAWGGMDIEKLHMRAEALMARDAKEITAQAVEVLDEANSAYMGTGEDANVLQAAGAGFAHGSMSAGSDMLEGIWTALSISKEDSVAAMYNLRRTYTKAYGPALATTMYVRAMEQHMQDMSPEHAQAIKEYLDAGYDPFRLGIDPMKGSVLLDASNVLEGRAQSISDWAMKTLNQNQGRWFDAGNVAGSTITMQAVATMATIATHSGFVGNMIGYGMPGLNQETKAQLAAGKSRKDALLMGGLRATSDAIANMITSDRFTQKWLGFMGFGPKVALGANAVGDVAASRSVLGMVKRYGGAFIKSAAKTGIEEAAIDQPLETLSWQFFGGAGEALIDGANVFKAAANGLKNIDAMEAFDDTIKHFGINFFSAMPLAIIGGALDAGSLARNDKLRGSRQAAAELSATGTPEAAEAFVGALASDLEDPAAVDQLNEELHDAEVSKWASFFLITDEHIAPEVDAAADAQKQADAHAVSEENSRQAAETGLTSATEAQERLNNGEGNPDENVTQIANGVQAHAKNSQSVLEHQREKEQKQAEADKGFTQAMQQAWEKASAEIAAQEEARRAERAEHERMQEEYDSPLAMDQAADDEFFDEPASESREERAGRIQKRIDQITEKFNAEVAANPDYTMDSEMEAELEHLFNEQIQLEEEADTAAPQATEDSADAEQDEAASNEYFKKQADSELVAQEAEEMRPVHQALSRTAVYVDDTQRANILARTGLKTIGQVNRKYGINLVTDKGKSEISLDGNFFSELADLAPGRIPRDVDVAEDALMDIVERKKEIRNRQVGVRMNRITEKGGGVKRAPLESQDGLAVTPTQTRGKAKKNPVQTYKRLAKSLGIGQAFGTRKMNGLEGVASGYYDPHSRHAASDTNHASSIETVAHEIGHHIGERLGITGTSSMIANLPDRFSQYPAAELPDEAFSEFFWRYMLSDDEARRFAGDGFVSDFERRMRREGILRDVKKAQRETRQYMLAQADERMKLMIRDRSDKKNGDTISERIAEVERHWVTALVDSTRPAEDVNTAVREAAGGTLLEQMNLRNSALMQSTAPRRAFNLLTRSLTDIDGTIVGDSLSARLERSGIKGKQFDELVTYMLAKHSLDRDAQDRPVFDRAAISQAETKSYIARIESDHPEIAKAERAFQEFRHDFMMEYMVKTGYMTQEMLDTFESRYPHYVPTYRVKDRGKRGVGGQTYEIRRATGSTEQIINPMDSFVDMVNTIVAMNLRNETAKTWDRVYQTYDGMGIFGREVTEDQRVVIMNMEDVQSRVRDTLEGNVDGDMLQGVLDIIGTEQIRKRGTGDVNMPNILSVQMPDGSKRFYEMFDMELFDMFAGTQDSGKSIFAAIAPITRGMSMLTTGSNPLFFMRNAMRDYQNSVNYGSWASNYLTGSAVWLKSAWDVFTKNGDYQQYMALGGGGWTRADTKSRKGAEEYRGELFKGYNTSNIGRGAKWAGRKIWNIVTANGLNELVEQASRYAEYRYGKHDRSTPEGRREAYLAAQEVTTDFSRKGNALAAREARMLVPFLNASLQGVYRTGRQFTEAEKGRAATRFVKTVINTGLASALASAWMIQSLDEDEQEEFFWLSGDLKAKHMYIPNFAPGVLGEAPLIRIPLNQDPLAYAIHGAVTNAMWSGEGEEWAIGICAIADNIMNSINPVGSTILDPLVSMATNRNWYGSNIVPRRMEEWYPTTQYTGETPDVFVETSRLLDAATGIALSPMMIQYIAEQYTGFVGQIAIPMLTKDENSGKIQGIKAVIQKARSTLTSDPLKSNDVISCVYDSDELLASVTKAKKNGKPLDMLRHNLTDREARRAENEAYDLTHKGGAVHTALERINDGYGEIDEIEANDTLTDEQKYQLISDVRREMIEAALDANEEVQAFRETYITGESYLTRFMRAPTID